ncbi:MarR family transcriptional regulator [Paenibacillus qinlingensis]|uniref:DNA-binding MarR family transcriptional regulator n=1 Tax=Paenibacillus qinlingensis TaxID=1837343 RepID=A0ABU1NU75_9BACL|nr:MarR family transcriptional regulator [Paenibacillus qinlingensis]MDR6551037.1 DNA-binding MarR family transcriptional regulator [Paenibacillus qinlingensis]
MINNQMLTETLGFLQNYLQLSNLEREIYTETEKIHNSHGLSTEKFHALFFLYVAANEGEPLGPSDIGVKINVTRASMTGVIDDLEKRQLLERTGHPVDRRKVILKLTEKGTQLVENQMPLITEWICKVNQAFTPEERNTFSLYLMKMRQTLDSLKVIKNNHS